MAAFFNRTFLALVLALLTGLPTVHAASNDLLIFRARGQEYQVENPLI